MLHSLPEETTQLLIDLCTMTAGSLRSELLEETGTPSATRQSTTSTTTTVASSAGGASYLSYLALNRGLQQPPLSMDQTTSTAQPPSPSTKTIKADALPMSGRSTPVAPATPTTAKGGGSQRAQTPTTQPQTTQSPVTPQPQSQQVQPASPVKLPSPRVCFAHFVDHMEQFVVFLETVASRRYGQYLDGAAGQGVSIQKIRSSSVSTQQQGEEEDREDQAAIWNTLLELYLTLPSSFVQGEEGEELRRKKREYEEKAMKVLRSQLPYDPTHALILCSTHGFINGLVLLWEKLGMYEDIIRFWIDRFKSGTDNSASQKVVDCLMTYGSGNTVEPQNQLYPIVLRFLTSTPELLGKHREDLKGILEHVEEQGIMPPLGVVQLLARNGVASVGLVKEWLMLRIKESQDEVENVSVRFGDYGFLLTFVAGQKLD